MYHCLLYVNLLVLFCVLECVDFHVCNDVGRDYAVLKLGDFG